MILSWALILGAIFGVIWLVATWPPDWKLVGLVCGLAVLGIVALIASIYGAGRTSGVFATGSGACNPEGARARLGHVAVAPARRPANRPGRRRTRRRLRVRTQPQVRRTTPAMGELATRVRGLARERRRPPTSSAAPWWISFSWYATAWWPIWDDDYEAVRTEVGAAVAAGVGIESLEELVANTSWFSFRKTACDRARASDRAPHRPGGGAPQRRRPRSPTADGRTAYALEGVAVPADAIEDPENFDPRAALQHENLEVRRVLLQHLGWDRVNPWLGTDSTGRGRQRPALAAPRPRR